MPYRVPFYSRFYSWVISLWNGVKDRAYGGKWDWLDILATILGGIVGQMLQLLLIYAFICVL